MHQARGTLRVVYRADRRSTAAITGAAQSLSDGGGGNRLDLPVANLGVADLGLVGAGVRHDGGATSSSLAFTQQPRQPARHTQ